MKTRLRLWLIRRTLRVMERQPDFIVHGGEKDGVLQGPYLKRWWAIPRNRFFNLYVHELLRSDDARALHDHPWWNVSILLNGSYIEHRILAGGVHTQTLLTAGTVVTRMPRTAHRLELLPGKTCITLFITGPRVRDWGFHCLRGWVPWQRFTKPGNAGAIGAGCGDTNEGSKA